MKNTNKKAPDALAGDHGANENLFQIQNSTEPEYCQIYDENLVAMAEKIKEVITSEYEDQ